jgi:hypothetical protein
MRALRSVTRFITKAIRDCDHTTTNARLGVNRHRANPYIVRIVLVLCQDATVNSLSQFFSKRW